MKKIFLAVMLFPVLAFSQGDSIYPKLVGDTLFVKCGFKIYKGQMLKMGTGSMNDGDFKFIRRSSTSLFQVSGSQIDANASNALPRSFSNLEFKVVRIDKRGSKRNGYVFYPIINVGTIRYEVDVNNAIPNLELSVPDECKPQKTQGQTVIIKQEPSIADELIKLKKLYDDGVLTSEEYEIAKKKVIERN